MSLKRQFHAAVAAAQFLTRVPLPGGMQSPGGDETLLRSSVVFFPLVGGLIGAFTGGVIWSALWIWPVIIAVVVGLVAEALLTGGFHEDALADSCDAFGGRHSREDVLRVMKDSRIGSFGVLGLTLALLLRGACLGVIPAHELLITVAASGTIGRWAILVLMGMTPPVPNREGLAKDLGRQIGRRELVAGTFLSLPGMALSGFFNPLHTALGVFVVTILSLGWGRYVLRRIGGVTGDCLGCGCYLAQCAFLLCMAVGKT